MTLRQVDTAKDVSLQYIVELLVETQDKLDKIDVDNKQILVKLDVLLSNLVEKTQVIKSEDRPIEEKVTLIEETTLKIIASNPNYLDKKNTYTKLLKNIIMNWEEIDTSSCDFLIMGEYLFSTFHEARVVDFSSCVLQYTKALENGLFQKLFKPFLQTYAYSKDNFRQDFKDIELRTFAKQVIKGSREKLLTMGNMAFVLRNLNSNKKLFEDFNKFIAEQDLSLFDVSTVQDIGFITKEYRNKAAHTETLNYDKASECKNKVLATFDNIYM